ncbi:MAG: hypothetical protein CMH91_01630 [Oceanicaulis sp.]|uniref:hypothetical protein n=1 Tax=unclassified Oceanicaulis TaxID=2632123 RepID=UPI000C4C71B1|nr:MULTISPECIES: hypothetical protein [unclassified Oceanicaulis]MBC37749.1 hypothetical protein [Oceanicaulis sp.]MBG36904.1 hypothetical protein [Oceanicaulis sp.]HBU63293.1 hypothetical protein [Oceanicaulis sp.]|tara:strand:- start:153 stop:428 length:276 start_codon:yes stop_codon:yes gene_type:complete
MTIADLLSQQIGAQAAQVRDFLQPYKDAAAIRAIDQLDGDATQGHVYQGPNSLTFSDPSGRVLSCVRWRIETRWNGLTHTARVEAETDVLS